MLVLTVTFDLKNYTALIHKEVVMSEAVFFVENAEELAKQKMDNINPELSEKFQLLIKFLSRFPESCSNPRSKQVRKTLVKQNI